MSDDDESALHESPIEFLAGATAVTGTCEAQSVLPLPDGTHAGHCTCGRWDVIASSQEEGLELARAHTAETGAALRAGATRPAWLNR
jgi:hypothetical protein